MWAVGLPGLGSDSAVRVRVHLRGERFSALFSSTLVVV